MCRRRLMKDMERHFDQSASPSPTHLGARHAESPLHFAAIERGREGDFCTEVGYPREGTRRRGRLGV